MKHKFLTDLDHFSLKLMSGWFLSPAQEGEGTFLWADGRLGRWCVGLVVCYMKIDGHSRWDR